MNKKQEDKYKEVFEKIINIVFWGFISITSMLNFAMYWAVMMDGSFLVYNKSEFGAMMLYSSVLMILLSSYAFMKTANE